MQQPHLSWPCFLLQEKVAEEPAAPTAALGDALDHTITLALQAGQVQRDCGLDILPEDFLKATLKFGLVEVRHASSRIHTMHDHSPVLTGHWICVGSLHAEGVS